MAQIAALPKFEIPLGTADSKNGAVSNNKNWYFFFSGLSNAVTGGLNATVPLEKVTNTGSNGQLVFTNGILTGYTAPT